MDAFLSQLRALEGRYDEAYAALVAVDNMQADHHGQEPTYGEPAPGPRQPGCEICAVDAKDCAVHHTLFNRWLEASQALIDIKTGLVELCAPDRTAVVDGLVRLMNATEPRGGRGDVTRIWCHLPWYTWRTTHIGVVAEMLVAHPELPREYRDRLTTEHLEVTDYRAGIAVDVDWDMTRITIGGTFDPSHPNPQMAATSLPPAAVGFDQVQSDMYVALRETSPIADALEAVVAATGRTTVVLPESLSPAEDLVAQRGLVLAAALTEEFGLSEDSEGRSPQPARRDPDWFAGRRAKKESVRSSLEALLAAHPRPDIEPATLDSGALVLGYWQAAEALTDHDDERPCIRAIAALTFGLVACGVTTDGDPSIEAAREELADLHEWRLLSPDPECEWDDLRAACATVLTHATREQLARAPVGMPTALTTEDFARDPSPSVRAQAASATDISAETLELMAEDVETASIVAENERSSPELLARLASHPDDDVRAGVAANPNTPRDVVAALADDEVVDVRFAALYTGLLPDELHNRLVADSDIAWYADWINGNVPPPRPEK